VEPQGTAAVNSAFFTNAIAQINTIDLCADLQAVIGPLMVDLQTEVNTIKAQIAAFLPILNIPHDLGAVITWITNFVAPQQAAWNTYTAQLAALASNIGARTAAISAAIARIEGCSITVLTVTF
jgi:hypothetical protein